MARMSIDDAFLRDPRVRLLARACGWSVRETRGCLLDVWAICYDQETELLSTSVIDAVAEGETVHSAPLDFSSKLLESELATRDRSGKVRVHGVRDRIAYLRKQRESGRQGGINRAQSVEKEPKRPLSTRSSTKPSVAQASLKPPTASVPDSSTASVSASVPEELSREAPPSRVKEWSDHHLVIAAWDSGFEKSHGTKPTWSVADFAQVKRLLAQHPRAEIERRMTLQFESPPNFPPQPWAFKTFVQRFDECARIAPSAKLPERKKTNADLLLDEQMKRIAAMKREEAMSDGEMRLALAPPIEEPK